MAITAFLAMTEEEFHTARPLPKRIAWMACHFAPYGRGLTDLPKALPEGSILLLDDRIPEAGHDPELICRQLTDAVDTLGCEAVVLDLQRDPAPGTLALCQRLVNDLPCPVAVPPKYAADGEHPLFLPPVPPGTALKAWLDPWTGRELWLELALDTVLYTVGPEGSRCTPISRPDHPLPHEDPALCCHYEVVVSEEDLRFTLTRTHQDLMGLMEEAKKLGVTHGLGLYQELK